MANTSFEERGTSLKQLTTAQQAELIEFLAALQLNGSITEAEAAYWHSILKAKRIRRKPKEST